MLKLEFTASTNGQGYWSTSAKPVKLTKLGLNYISDDFNFGELIVMFSKDSWNVKEDGIVYTDPQFLLEFKAALQDLGWSKSAVNEIDYSEAGMQGDDYISFDVGPNFVAETIISGGASEHVAPAEKVKNNLITLAFLARITPQGKNKILSAVAKHYGISKDQALEEITDPEAEHLLDYMKGPERLATSILMQKHGFA